MHLRNCRIASSIDANRFSLSCKVQENPVDRVDSKGAVRKDKRSRWSRIEAERQRKRGRKRDALSGHSIICRGELPPLSLLSAGRSFSRSFGFLSSDVISAYLARQVATPWHPHTFDTSHRCITRIRRSLFHAPARATNDRWCVKADKTDMFHSSCCRVYIT